MDAAGSIEKNNWKSVLAGAELGEWDEGRTPGESVQAGIYMGHRIEVVYELPEDYDETLERLEPSEQDAYYESLISEIRWAPEPGEEWEAKCGNLPCTVAYDDLDFLTIIWPNGSHTAILIDTPQDLARMAGDLAAGADLAGWEDGIGGAVAPQEWAVISRPRDGDGDEFTRFCRSREEAVKSAAADWEGLDDRWEKPVKVVRAARIPAGETNGEYYDIAWSSDPAEVTPAMLAEFLEAQDADFAYIPEAWNARAREIAEAGPDAGSRMCEGNGTIDAYTLTNGICMQILYDNVVPDGEDLDADFPPAWISRVCLTKTRRCDE